jgi:hypothetical protein
LDPDNTNNLVVAPLPDGLRAPSPLRALRAFVVNTDMMPGSRDDGRQMRNHDADT